MMLCRMLRCCCVGLKEFRFHLTREGELRRGVGEILEKGEGLKNLLTADISAKEKAEPPFPQTRVSGKEINAVITDLGSLV